MVSFGIYRLVGLVVKSVHHESGRPGFDSRLRRGSFSKWNHTSNFKIGTPVVTLPGAWRHRVSVGTGQPVNCDWLR